MKEEIYLIDGSSYIYRAYHAIAPLTNSKGVATNAVLGFVKMVQKLINEHGPKYLAIAFDSKGPVFRHDLYREYKANRPPMPEDLREQLPYIKEFVRASNILMLEEAEVEADDILASIAARYTKQGYRVVIVSGDKDLLQLVDDSVAMYDPMKNKVMDRAEVEKKYGVRPDQLLDFFALVGDSADNVPGVPGVGPKTAEKLIADYGSLDGLYERVDTLKKSKMKEKIIDNRQQAYLSRQLIDLKKDVKIPEKIDQFTLQKADDSSLASLYTELEFLSLLKGIDTSEKIETDTFKAITTVDDLKKLRTELDHAHLLVVDTETTSLNARRAKLVGLSLCTSLERAYYIPVGHLDEQGCLLDGQLDEKSVIEFLAPYLQSEKLLKVGHNLKYDFTVLSQHSGLELRGPLADTLIAAYLTESGGRSLKLDDLCQERGLRMTSFTEVVNGDKREDCFAYVPIDNAVNYSCEDVYGTLVLWQEFEKKLDHLGLSSLFWDVEMKVLRLLAQMEITGICIDLSVLAALSLEFNEKLSLLEKEIFQLSGHEFNINSPRQLGVILFEEQGLPHGRKTKTGYSTDVKVLETLAAQHELPRLVLQYRTMAKLLSTYVDKLSLLKDPVTGRIHTSFNQAVTATGRLSSSDPNLQNIPIRTEEGGRIRGAFVPGDGLIFLSADYSQIDLRVLAHYSQDEALIEAFRSGADIHARTAAEIFSVSSLLVTSEMRRVAKSINFGIVYGMSSFGLSNQLGISRKDAQRFIDKYFGLYSGVQRFMEDIVMTAREDGFVTTLLGRRRTVADIHAKNRSQREFAERMAINTPIQGTAADIIKLAMIHCDEALKANGLQAKMLLQIHDELVFELPEEEMEQTKVVIKKAMEGALTLDVPLVANFEIGHSLAK
ncbi:DNA polymerase I [Desulforhopalus sp. IMCC35007]|uniref:DNA polymerase I n=1 Tax=Desulforhopalus sp. IMCC35007 TaxID=2569543 RepID=UPI0010AEB8BF|nr:DNA polymerase I [Desulforhopalus sp. IMCC35007]TKB08737.1 DNA polymerase I [Desulforhopalus sp. IMCC35007]